MIEEAFPELFVSGNASPGLGYLRHGSFDLYRVTLNSFLLQDSLFSHVL
jgi:hypothetical protein